jgi:hypothetical protein
MPIRIKDSYQKSIFDFADEILVVCPECAKQALVTGRDYKLTCGQCGRGKYLREKPYGILFSSNARKFAGRYVLIGAPVDPFFHLPLWLRAPCCGHTLWAYNYRHLAFLRSHVEAQLRERAGQPKRNASLGSRLPGWMTTAKNRTKVLKCIDAF